MHFAAGERVENREEEGGVAVDGGRLIHQPVDGLHGFRLVAGTVLFCGNSRC